MNYVKRENEDNKDDGKDKRPFLVLLFVCGVLVFVRVGLGGAVAGVVFFLPGRLLC